MKLFKYLLQLVALIVLIVFGFFVIMTLFYIVAPFGGYDLLFFEFIGGFWFFLRENLTAMSWDAGTWGPALGAFLLATLLAHRFLSAWAVRTNRHWSFATSLCVALVVPVLFVVAFIIPGVLLQWEMLRQVPWLDSNR